MVEILPAAVAVVPAWAGDFSRLKAMWRLRALPSETTQQLAVMEGRQGDRVEVITGVGVAGVLTVVALVT